MVGEDHLDYGPNASLTVTDTADGLLVAGTINSGPGISVSVLLQGVHGAYTLDDLMIA